MIYRIFAIVALVIVTVGYAIYSQKSLEGQIVSDQKAESVLARLPSAEFTTLEGKPFNLDEFYQNEKPGLVIVHYWGTWCAPCEAELPELMNFIKRFEAQSEVKFLLVAVNDEALKVTKHLKSLPIPSKASIHWLLDNKNVYRDQFGTTRVPETFVFSSDKTTLRKFIGPQEWNKTMFFQTFDELLQMSTTKL